MGTCKYSLPANQPASSPFGPASPEGARSTRPTGQLPQDFVATQAPSTRNGRVRAERWLSLGELRYPEVLGHWSWSSTSYAAARRTFDNQEEDGSYACEYMECRARRDDVGLVSCWERSTASDARGYLRAHQDCGDGAAAAEWSKRPLYYRFRIRDPVHEWRLPSSVCGG